MKNRMNTLIPVEVIEKNILLIRGEKVILDTDLAELYGVTTKRLNEQVKRNRNRFPSDFMFKLNSREKAEVVANCDHLHKLKFSPVLPYAFTEHGTIMLASVLNSQRAIEVSIYVVRAFVKLRELLATHRDFAQRLTELERKHGSHDTQIRSLFEAIRELMEPSKPKHREIGFLAKEKKERYGVSSLKSNIKRKNILARSG